MFEKTPLSPVSFQLTFEKAKDKFPYLQLQQRE